MTPLVYRVLASNNVDNERKTGKEAINEHSKKIISYAIPNVDLSTCLLTNLNNVFIRENVIFSASLRLVFATST